MDETSAFRDLQGLFVKAFVVTLGHHPPPGATSGV